MQKLQFRELLAALNRERRRRSLPSRPECRLLRLRAGLTQADIAVSIGITAAAVSRYESGKRRPRPKILDRYLAAIQVLSDAKTT